MAREGADLIEYQDGTRVNVFFWDGPGYSVQFVQARVVNEKIIAGKHWVKVEFEYEREDSKLWIPRWRVLRRDIATTLRRDDDGGSPGVGAGDVS
jgi:hypothetical protein